MFDRCVTVFVAVSLAVLIWLYARSREQEMLDHVAIPVQVQLAPGQQEQYALDVAEPAHVIVTFTGMPARMRELRGLVQRGEMRVVVNLTVPEQNPAQKTFHEMVRIDSGELHTPPGVKSILIEGHDSVRVTVHRLVEKRLPVRFDYSLESHTGPLVLDPATVLVRGPQEILDRTTALPTQPWVLSSRGDGEKPRGTRVPLVQELDGKPIRTQPGSVLVHLPSQQRKVYELQDVPVRFLCPPGFGFRPRFINERAGKITLRVQGPVQVDPPRVHVFVDLTTNEFTPRMYSERPTIQLPKDFTLAQEAPREITFELVPQGSP